MREKFNAVASRLLLLTLICLAGCASPDALKISNQGYAESYGEACNKQLLLNLARLANDDPVCFMQLGSITPAYNFTSGLGFSPSYVDNSPNYLTSTTTGGTPPTGANFISAILDPVTPQVLSTFYDQKYGAELLTRHVSLNFPSFPFA